MSGDNTKLKPPKGRRPHDDDDCQDRVCSDTKSNFMAWMRNDKSKQAECPLDREGLGRNTWSVLHTMAASYPKQPTSQDKKNMEEFINLMSIMYPCSHCAKDFRQDIKELPPKLDSREALADWFCQIHNKVNRKLHKPEFDCRKVDERWRTGWKDGSCI